MTKKGTFVKTNIPGYEKNVRTNVVINNNNGEYQAFLKAKQKAKKMRCLEETVKKQSDQLSELREMVLKLLEKE